MPLTGHSRAVRNHRFKLIQRHIEGRFASEEFYDLLEGGPIDSEGTPTRDDFEQNDLLQNRADWPKDGVVESNYLALHEELARVLPPLP